MATGSGAQADVFGTGANQFTIDFVVISNATNPVSGRGIVLTDYRTSVFEITNGQWNKFKAEYGPVKGYPTGAYDGTSLVWGGDDCPTNMVSWYEAAQFVNWLNISTGHHAAYKFTGTQGQDDYTYANWTAAEAAGGVNLRRHKDAYYFLPTEDEWVKAAYWNGTTMQDYATRPGESVTQGNGLDGTGWNYMSWSGAYATDSHGPWNVGSGSRELNGTYDMMGNVFEWTESSWYANDYIEYILHMTRGGSYQNDQSFLSLANRGDVGSGSEFRGTGFRVASIPEPSTMGLLVVGLGILARKMRK
ncbi:MAG: SUMF1/EgtB/PvdO family nonheme iron enzyme [Planctomycetaceae bacterium]|nr:SUMF1/EgtB/PvdO family nonheme iron enzyme [Planctomycetaceae bacterium]